MHKKTRAILRELARLKIAELAATISALRQDFPNLRTMQPATHRKRRYTAAELKAADPTGTRVVGGRQKTAPTAQRKRRPMTAAQRKAIGVRMRRYWAERRKDQR